jgi:hypothetical protein
MFNICISDQEQGLEALSKVISRQKEISETIGNEIDLQNGRILLWVIPLVIIFIILLGLSLPW